MLAATVCVLTHFVLTHPLSALEVNARTGLYAVLLGFFSTVLPSFMLTEAVLGSFSGDVVGVDGSQLTK